MGDLSEPTWNREKCLSLRTLATAFMRVLRGGEESQSKPKTHSQAGEGGQHIWVVE